MQKKMYRFIFLLGVCLNNNSFPAMSGQTKDIVLFSTAATGSVEEMEKLLKKDISVINNFHRKTGRTPIFYAVIKNNQEMVTYLLSKGAKVNFVDKKGWSPLDYSFLVKKINNLVVFSLLANGAYFNLEIENFEDKDYAAEIFKRSMTYQNECRQTILHLGAKFGDYYLLKFLLYFIDNTEIKDIWGRTPLDLLKHYHTRYLFIYKDLPKIWEI